MFMYLLQVCIKAVFMFTCSGMYLVHHLIYIRLFFAIGEKKPSRTCDIQPAVCTDAKQVVTGNTTSIHDQFIIFPYTYRQNTSQGKSVISSINSFTPNGM